MRGRQGLCVFFVLIGAFAGACSGVRSTSDPRTGPDPGSLSPSPSQKWRDSKPAARRRDVPPGVTRAPSWLGERVLPTGPDGLGVARGTPRMLRDRRLVTEDLLPPPQHDRFVSSIRPVPRRVLKRSTWRSSCPVSRRDLSYVTTTFWGFDREPHTGELILHRSVAADVVDVFRALYRARWPIEEMRVTSRPELNEPPTGDGNNTSAFVCRPVRLGDEWSQHAYGFAVDVNPFHNPYVRGDLILPELATWYRDRSRRRPGMIRSGDVVTSAFERIGWSWGGGWTTAKDWMHFSRSGD